MHNPSGIQSDECERSQGTQNLDGACKILARQTRTLIMEQKVARDRASQKWNETGKKFPCVGNTTREFALSMIKSGVRARSQQFQRCFCPGFRGTSRSSDPIKPRRHQSINRINGYKTGYKHQKRHSRKKDLIVKPLSLNQIIGGQCRTRTCDLLLVRQAL